MNNIEILQLFWLGIGILPNQVKVAFVCKLLTLHISI